MQLSVQVGAERETDLLYLDTLDDVSGLGLGWKRADKSISKYKINSDFNSNC